MDQQTSVDVSGLRVDRGGTTVLHDIDLHVAAGRITGLLGPSGSGKSTLLRSLVGTQQVTAGQVQVLGHPAGSAPLRHLVGYSTQSAAVYADLTVAENLRYFAAVRGGDVDCERVLEQVGLTRYAQRLAGNLSGGQLGRVSLAVALLGDSPLLVLDEPTTGLDPVLRVQLWELFRSLAEAGTTLVVSSHVMDEAEQCDDLVLLRAGRVLARGTVVELQARTGTDRIEDAFIALVTDNEQGAA